MIHYHWIHALYDSTQSGTKHLNVSLKIDFHIHWAQSVQSPLKAQVWSLIMSELYIHSDSNKIPYSQMTR